jgi:AcrR family transcriptional regulator
LGCCYKILLGIIVFIHDFMFIDLTRQSWCGEGTGCMTGMMEGPHRFDGQGTHTPTARAREILAVAAGLFARQGYAGTRMTDVAAGLGVTKPIIYRFYRSKEELFAAVVEQALQAIVTEAISQCDAIPLLTADVLAPVPEIAMELVANEELTMPWIIALGESSKVPELGRSLEAKYARPLIAALEGLLDRTTAAGKLQQPSPGSRVLAWLLAAPFVQLVARRSFGADVHAEDFGLQQLRAHMDGFARAWLTP